MNRILSLLRKSLFSNPKKQLGSEEIRIIFAKRYMNFRSLLTANNNALQAMAELEKMYYSGESYRMAFVRSKITAILVNVYKMIRNLADMADGRYSALNEIFETIHQQLEEIIERQPPLPLGPYVIELNEVDRTLRAQTGEKMANLGDIVGLENILVPPGFVITASATRAFLTKEIITEINRQLQQLDPDDFYALHITSEKLQQLVMDADIPPDLEELLYFHYSRLEKASRPGCRIALRSSALGEDAGGVSFAGLYRTLLNIDKNQLITAYKKVIAGKYGARAIAYRYKRGFRHQDIEMCVGCLVMVDSLVSGVVYSTDPANVEREVIRINATSGTGKGVVDGTGITDLFVASRQAPYPILSKEVRQKGKLSGSEQPSILSHIQIKRLCETAMLLEKHFGSPQDIEWSYDRTGQLFILQSRPIMVSQAVDHVEGKGDAAEDKVEAEPLFTGGICASAGVACGEVYKVSSFEDTHKFPLGAVLVIKDPVPDWAPLLSRASAVLAEHGSEAGHLATVSREFAIPALFNLKNAVNALHNKELVTVDSRLRSVFEGKIEALLRRRKLKKDIMAGSPVQRIATEALQLITPLNLNDPTSHHFKSSRCETLHDITRFCHEKSVLEMFNFGRSQHFLKGTAKRLIGNAPMEWWVINLADGFRDGTADEKKEIRIEDIVSLPMLAIWKGITAIVWGGPPPISTKGFGSILFQSVMRPELDPAVASPMTTKNYFLISRHFCNLSVRLGYHYAMIECYLSDLLTESYITFRFKGGAADMRRKAVRANLLGDILKRYDFGVELRSDAILARVKKKSPEFIEKRLMILGYLTLHTRQLDMVMNQPEAVNHYRKRFLADIEKMLS